MLHEIHLERAADTSVLQCNEAVVFCAYNSAFLYQIGVNVDFADVVHYYGKLHAAFICQYVVYKCRFSAAEITGQEQHRNFFFC